MSSFASSQATQEGDAGAGAGEATNPVGDVGNADAPISVQAVPMQAGASPPARPPQACRFFLLGTCRNGSECRFSHDPAVCAQAQAAPPVADRYKPPSSGPRGPTIIEVPQGHPIFSIDVECVATGVRHDARSIAQVALVDEWSRPMFNVLIRQTGAVASYITPLTGLTKEMIDKHGLPLADALALLRAHLPPNAILVGQNILKDVQWLQLAETVDYFQLIDISALFRVWNPSRNEYTAFSQDHCAKVWLGIENRVSHDAVQDAQISMALFNAYRSVQWDTPRLLHMQSLLLNTPRIPGFSSTHPSVDGCCMGNQKRCTCGAPFTF